MRGPTRGMRSARLAPLSGRASGLGGERPRRRGGWTLTEWLAWLDAGLSADDGHETCSGWRHRSPAHESCDRHQEAGCGSG